jgi:hypothetical protein
MNFITFGRTQFITSGAKKMSPEVKDARINCCYQKQYLRTARREEKFKHCMDWLSEGI